MPDEKRVLTPEEALHTIAIELVKANRIAHANHSLMKKVVDSMKNGANTAAQTQLESMKMFQTTLEPLMQVFTEGASRPPAIASTPVLQLPDEVEVPTRRTARFTQKVDPE